MPAEHVGTDRTRPLLVVFSGLSGTGKTTLARELSRRLPAMHLRIDAIEQALVDAGIDKSRFGPAGYLAAYALARENLEIGHHVVADAVNAVGVARDGWRKSANGSAARLVEIEVVCSDNDEHRRRVEQRLEHARGERVPTWAEVVKRRYEPFDATIVLDTSSESTVNSVTRLVEQLSRLHS